MSLYHKLKKYAQGGTYPMHIPGHKRNPGFLPAAPEGAPSLPFDIDITEIHGFDDLHDPQGVLLETSKLAASLYGSREAFLLTCGSTVGILAAIGSHAQHGDKILADANCHRSVANAAGLFGLELAYITPEVDEASGVPCSITPAAVESALLDNPGAKLVVITSPSYEGVVSDISSIAELAQKAGALLLVDCAHGAHLGFSDYFPKNPVSLGADMVVMSLHKTLPALTQCSLLHVCSERADPAAIKRMLYVLQTSSPSYALMASIDHCLRLLASDGERLFREYEENLEYFYERFGRTQFAPTFTPEKGFFDFDRGKIVIVKKVTRGRFFCHLLRKRYEIELERECPRYAIAMTSICDTRAGFARLADALCEIDIR